MSGSSAMASFCPAQRHLTHCSLLMPPHSRSQTKKTDAWVKPSTTSPLTAMIAQSERWHDGYITCYPTVEMPAHSSAPSI
eukprot:11019220-Ditylum_brightwellii.AAC.1